MGISKGGTESAALIGFKPGPDTNDPTGYLILSAIRCTELKTRRIPLSPKGLPAPPVRFEKFIECRVTQRVLLRLRATLDRRPRFRLSSGNRLANVNFSQAAFAVATNQATPRPIAFGDIGATGQTRLFYSFSRCE